MSCTHTLGATFMCLNNWLLASFAPSCSGIHEQAAHVHRRPQAVIRPSASADHAARHRHRGHCMHRTLQLTKAVPVTTHPGIHTHGAAAMPVGEAFPAVLVCLGLGATPFVRSDVSKCCAVLRRVLDSTCQRVVRPWRTQQALHRALNLLSCRRELSVDLADPFCESGSQDVAT